jgi:Family of unknown function (DUF5313)
MRSVRLRRGVLNGTLAPRLRRRARVAGKGLAPGCERPTVWGVRPQHSRPTVLRWIWYAYGGGLPRSLAPWVLHDTTTKTWVLRHLARAVVQLAPFIAVCLAAIPVPFGYRLSAAVGGLLLALMFSVAYMTETTEHRVAKAGFEAGTAARVREERAEKDRQERLAPYRRDGAGSWD